MTKVVFKSYNPNDSLLLPPCLGDYLPQNHKARVVSAIIDRLDISDIESGYKGGGTSSYNPRMLLKVIVYAYLNNVYSGRQMEKLLVENIAYMWLSGMQTPDFRTINLFRSKRLSGCFDSIFTQIVVLLHDEGLVSLNVQYIDGTKIESAANKYTFVWKGSTEKNKAKLEANVKSVLESAEKVLSMENADEEQELTADEMQLLMKDGTFSRGSMLTNAWIISRQDSVHFNQIKSTEMLGYFYDSKLYRFDALGGVSAIFYMADEDVITTVNLKESRSLTAALKDGQAQRLLYMESIKSDAYPVGDVEPEKQRLKGFVWRGDERPVSRETITAREVRTSERKQYEHMQRPLFRETNKYFDNYMNDLIERRNEERRAEAARRQAAEAFRRRGHRSAHMSPLRMNSARCTRQSHSALRSLS